MRILPDKLSFQLLVNNHLTGKLRNDCFINKSTPYCMLFNSKCVLRYFKEQTEQVFIQDGEQVLIKHETLELLGDKSQFYYKPYKLQLPTNMTEIPLIHTFYKTHKKSDVSLHIEQFQSGIVRDIWFEVPDELVNNSITLDVVCSFLQN